MVLLPIEAVLTVAAILVALLAPNLGSCWFERIETGFRNVARRRVLSVLLVAMSALVARAVVLPIRPVPMPQVGDEFSHLLLADTLLHERLANPTPPLWEHFETLSVNMRPTYASVYPPVQGIFLASGRLLTGHPFFGVMLSVAVMCGAICWMLQGWMSAEWALLGGLLAVLRFGMFTYWADGYMGGAPSAIGGALALGALPRIKDNFRARDAVILAIGFAVLANTRPYEGFVLSLLIGVALLYWLFRDRSIGLRKIFRNFVAPMLIVLVIAGLAMGYYFWRVTGSPLRTPYQVNWETYGMMPKFIWQSLRPNQPVALRHDALNDSYHVWEFDTYANIRTLNGLLIEWATRLIRNWGFYLGPILTLPLFAAMATAPYGFGWKKLDPNTRFLILSATVFVAGLAVEVFSYPHYAAPITCIIIALVLIAMRALRAQAHRGKAFGLALTRAIAIVCVLMLALRAVAVPLHIPMARVILTSSYDAVRDDIPSNKVEALLENTPGQHLLIVHYVPGSQDWMGWVYNGADIDHSKIVRAWDMGPEKNRELVDYFRDRQAWFVNASDKVPVLRPYIDEASR